MRASPWCGLAYVRLAAFTCTASVNTPHPARRVVIAGTRPHCTSCMPGAAWPRCGLYPLTPDPRMDGLDYVRELTEPLQQARPRGRWHLTGLCSEACSSSPARVPAASPIPHLPLGRDERLTGTVQTRTIHRDRYEMDWPVLCDSLLRVLCERKVQNKPRGSCHVKGVEFITPPPRGSILPDPLTSTAPHNY